MSEIKLAIVIPYYKLTYFEETLRSLSNQTDNRFNLYIGNDKSPENPQDLINKYSSIITKYKEFEKNLGSKGKLVEQWNRCINLSENEDWLMILADDDYISDNFVEEFYKNVAIAKSKGINLIRFKMRRVDFDNKFLIDLTQPFLHYGKDYLWEDELHERFISISENVFSRKVFELKGFRNYPLAWRVPFMMYLDFSLEREVLGVNNAFVAIRRSKDQLTRRTDMDVHKRNATKYCYFDILNEYEHLFSNKQKLRFLKIYSYHVNNDNKLNKSLKRLYFEYGGFLEVIKYQVKSILQIK